MTERPEEVIDLGQVTLRRYRSGLAAGQVGSPLGALRPAVTMRIRRS